VESKSFIAKSAIIVFVVIAWAVLTFSQSRQDSGPKLPESRLPVDNITNTVKGVANEDLQAKVDALELRISTDENKINVLESRVRQLEIEQNR
jgi:hypothetical protein